MNDELSMYVVYEKPTDYPDQIIVRRFVARLGQPVPMELVYRGEDISAARRTILGLAPSAIRFGRDASDARAIFECWI